LRSLLYVIDFGNAVIYLMQSACIWGSLISVDPSVLNKLLWLFNYSYPYLCRRMTANWAWKN